MELTTAIHNYDILSTLKPFQKLTVDDKGAFQKDLRWGQFVRRAVTQDSKDQLLKPLAETVNTVTEYCSTSCNIEVVHSVILTLNNLEKTLLETYPNWTEMSKCIKNLKEELTNDYDIPRVKLEDTDIHPTEKEMIDADCHNWADICPEDWKNENTIAIDLEDKIVLMEMDLTYIHLENDELKEKIGLLMEQMQTQISNMQDQIDILEEDQNDIEDYIDESSNLVRTYVNDKLFALKQEIESDHKNLEIYIDENLDDMETDFTSKINSVQENQRLAMEDYVDENIDEIESELSSMNQSNKMSVAQLKTLQKLYYEKSKTHSNTIKEDIEGYLDTLDEDIETIFTFIKNRFCKSKQQ
jgi:hypothetical protein